MQFVKAAIFFILLVAQCHAVTPSPQKIRALSRSLDPRSIGQHLALYQLFPDSPEGKQALRTALTLLSGNAPNLEGPMTPINLPTSGVQAVVALVNKQPFEEVPDLTHAELSLVEHLAARLPNRRLKGFKATSEAQVLALPPEEIDLARGLFLSQVGEEANSLHDIRSYEAMMDLMALQVLTQVSLDSPPEAKVKALNRFVFEDMNFRFPPHSLYAKDIDLYTFLPSVLDTRRGVCLGVSILYACLAQRLALNVELITPPGHIYVRYREGDKVINIETTLRGVHIDSEEYLGTDTKSLQQRDIKETIGLAHVNQASVFWHNQEYQKALDAYQIAEKYLPNDKLVTELKGYIYLGLNQEDNARKLLEQVRHYTPAYAIGANTLPEDYLNGKTDAKGVLAIFQPVDETLKSLIKKRRSLEDTLKDYPNFRAGLLTRATTLLQMKRIGDALTTLEHYHKVDDTNPTVEYYLAVLYSERLHYPKAWEHLRQVEALLSAHDHHPKAIKELRRGLALRYPE